MQNVIAFMANPVVLLLMSGAYGVWATYSSKARQVANTTTSFVNAFAIFLVKITASAIAPAAIVPSGYMSALYAPASTLAVAAGLPSIPVGALFADSGWLAAVSYLLFKTFVHDVIEKGLGIQKQPPPK